MITARTIRLSWLAAPADDGTDRLALDALDAVAERDTWRTIALQALELWHRGDSPSFPKGLGLESIKAATFVAPGAADIRWDLR